MQTKKVKWFGVRAKTNLPFEIYILNDIHRILWGKFCVTVYGLTKTVYRFQIYTVFASKYISLIFVIGHKTFHLHVEVLCLLHKSFLSNEPIFPDVSFFHGVVFLDSNLMNCFKNLRESTSLYSYASPCQCHTMT